MTDLTIPVLVLEFQARSLYVQQLLQAEAGIKEYDASWLKNTGEVMRDATGKFAKKGATVDTPQQPQAGIMPGTMQMPGLGQAQQMTWTAMDMLKNGSEITGDLIQGLVQDPGFRQRAGLVAGLAGAKALEKILEKSKIDPRLEDKLNDFIAEATEKLADEYGDDKDPFAQAIRTAGTDEPPQGVPFQQRMEYDIAKYQAYTEALKNPKKYDKKKELIGKAVKASIPVVAYLGLTLGPEVIIGLVMKESLEAILVSAAVGQAVSFGANKAMDKANIENPWVRAGIDLAVGIGAGGLLASNKHFKVLSKADQATRQGKKIAETAIKNTDEGTFYDKLSKPVKEFMDARSKDILDSVKPLQEIKPTGIKLPEMKDIGWISKGKFFQNSVLAIPKELRSLPPNFTKNLLLKGTDWNNLKSASPNFIDNLLFDGAEIIKSIGKGKNQVMSAVVDGVERKILIAQGKISRGIDAAGEAIEDAFWWLLPKGMEALDASANWVDDVAKKMDDIYENKIKTFRPKVEQDIDNLKQSIYKGIDDLKIDVNLKVNEISQSFNDGLDGVKKAAQEWADNTVEAIEKKAKESLKFAQEDGLNRLDDVLESIDPQKWVDDITDSVQDLYKNKVQTIKPSIKKEMDELADHLSLEIDKLKIPDLAAKFKGKKAIADQWVKDVSDSMETFYNNEVKNLKQDIKKQVEDLQKIASEGVGKAKTKAQDYRKVTKQWSDDASKALKELYENEVKNFQPNLQKEMAELKSLISKQVGKLKKSTSLTAENVSKWVDDVSDTLKKLYKEKTASLMQRVNKKAKKFKQDFSDKLSEFNTKLSQKIESVKDLSSQAQDKILSEFVNAYVNSL
jgi:hypothetical protein